MDDNLNLEENTQLESEALEAKQDESNKVPQEAGAEAEKEEASAEEKKEPEKKEAKEQETDPEKNEQDEMGKKLKELEDRETKLKEREDEFTKTQVKSELTSFLNQKGMGESLLEPLLLLGLSKEETMEKAEGLYKAFNKALEEALNEKVKGKTPTESSGVVGSDKSTADVFAAALRR